MKKRNFRFLVKFLAVLSLFFSMHAFAGEKAGESGADKEKGASNHEAHETSDAPHADAAPAAESHDQSPSSGANDGGTLRPGMHENADVPVKPIPSSQVPKN